MTWGSVPAEERCAKGHVSAKTVMSASDDNVLVLVLVLVMIASHNNVLVPKR